MYITVTLSIKGREFDLQVDDNQSILHAVKTLEESFDVFSGSFPAFFRSMRCGLVSGYFTFQQAEIYSGDILTALLSY